MQYCLDIQNYKDDYCYNTFETSLAGEPLLILKEYLYFIIPVLNLGVYGLKSFKDGLDEITFIDKSYYFFRDIVMYEENVSLRKGGSFFGHYINKYKSEFFENKFQYNLHKIEMEMGKTKNYLYGATWKVWAKEFGILIPENSLESMYEEDFRVNIVNLTQLETNFLESENQAELNEFILRLN
jgi:hypothetical protein